MGKLSIFQINCGEHKFWVAAYTNIEALIIYCYQSDTNIVDFEKTDSINEVPQEEWDNYFVIEGDVDEENAPRQSFAQYMKENLWVGSICQTLA